MGTKMSGSGERLTEHELKLAEKKLGRPIPAPYRKFLLEHNGGRPEQSDFVMASKHRGKPREGTLKSFLGVNLSEETLDLSYVLDTFGDRLPRWLFPIARDPGGSLIGIATDGANAGKVYFWDHEYEAGDGEPPTEDNLYLVADSLDKFLAKLGG